MVMNAIFNYANCVFGEMKFWKTETEYDDDFKANLACTFHEEEVWDGHETFEELAVLTAKELADRAGLEDVTIKKHETRYLAIYVKGEHIASVKIDFIIDEGNRGMKMANGDTIGNLFTYGWKGLRNLERAAAA